MAADYTDLLALMGDVLRAVDRQTEENKKAIQELGLRFEQRMEQSDARFEAIFDRFATAVADGFIRMEKKIEGVKEEVAGVKQEVASVKQEVTSVKQEVAGVKQEVASVKQEVAGVKEEVANVKQEVAGLRTDVQQIDQRLARVEQNQATQADMLHRLEVLENIVLRKAS
ncbi:chromosome segregation ATPase [Hymenobacter luteus]|uniref:Chromosome segregation ATPase n=2 Tax=Hymenobacter TaxID=89966 RepID=A0A7W9T059_9BACT|nr:MULTISPECIES: hypothetical protein [Hymenobacter]MBB4601369.1 chromosome segregation ATPase [Hymenobacter latericoloratus]MBB6058424.1 chromosome segregation ATPase [Hymenobacter luteus]